MKKTFLLTTVASLLFTTYAFAQTPEFRMLEQTLALQGEHLPAKALQTQAQALITEYNETSSNEGREARLEQAMVDLQLYTPAQAHSIVRQLDHAAVKISASSPALAEQELARLFSTTPRGAQFSGCSTNAWVTTNLLFNAGWIVALSVNGGWDYGPMPLTEQYAWGACILGSVLLVYQMADCLDWSN